MSDTSMVDVEHKVDAVDAAVAEDLTSASPSAVPQPDETVEPQEEDQDEEEKPRGKFGKNTPQVKLPTYSPLWSAVSLPSARRRMCDVGVAPRRTAHVIAEGDSVIAYESRVSMSPLVIKKGSVYGNRFGNFHHIDMIGVEYGSKVSARGKTKGWIVLLPFSPDLWTNSLTHRTQILYQADISYIIFQLDLKPGDVIFESGTGSGSLTTALATTIRPHGHVHTFEFNADRVKKAKVDFENNKLSDVITVRERDVVGTGFPLVEGGVNAIFLDLPSPWCVLDSAKAALKHQARLCSFSPCIEQVQRVCVRLDELGFSEIITVEILLRSFEVQSHTTFPIAKPTAMANFKAQQQRQAADANTSDAATSETRKRALDDSSDAPAEKKLKLEDGAAAPAAASTDATEPAAATPAPVASAPAAAAAATPLARSQPPLTLVTTKPYQQMRGHTGYLTFAVCNKF